MSKANYYHVLGVSSTATPAEIRAAYTALCKELHPDKLVGLSPNLRKSAEERLKLVNEAYETLGDEELRAAYDRKRARSYRGPTFDEWLNELQSSVPLALGVQRLTQQEEKLWQNFIKDLHRLRERYGIPESPDPIEIVFPDDLTTRIGRIVALIVGAIATVTLSALLFGLLVHVIHLFIYGIRSPVFLALMGLGLTLFLPPIYIAVIVMTEASFSQHQKTELIFSPTLRGYRQQADALIAHFQPCKLWGCLYPRAYVRAVAAARRRFVGHCQDLLSRRQAKVHLFKALDPTGFTLDFVSHLSVAEQLLLIIALRQKQQEIRWKHWRKRLDDLLAKSVVFTTILILLVPFSMAWVTVPNPLRSSGNVFANSIWRSMALDRQLPMFDVLLAGVLALPSQLLFSGQAVLYTDPVQGYRLQVPVEFQPVAPGSWLGPRLPTRNRWSMPPPLFTCISRNMETTPCLPMSRPSQCRGSGISG
ncbi:MAG: J domain-containing protein [Gloeomargarita sp. SKYBB_i_bin120]|nr:J domain-containing protein [Gloeomargarita sp. SKYG98]MCS7291372.1 J domain-containing protein [Gloeomargarita sp. SKYB120]MDW8176932.1 J domain-containing protein [Gloeomargarita sp. SKYBB_i_bin120]